MRRGTNRPCAHHRCHAFLTYFSGSFFIPLTPYYLCFHDTYSSTVNTYSLSNNSCVLFSLSSSPNVSHKAFSSRPVGSRWKYHMSFNNMNRSEFSPESLKGDPRFPKPCKHPITVLLRLLHKRSREVAPLTSGCDAMPPIVAGALPDVANLFTAREGDFICLLGPVLLYGYHHKSRGF